MRRFYIGRLAVHGEALLSLQHLILSDTYDDEDVTISNNSLGARINVGLEYAVNIDCNVGIFAGFQAFRPWIGGPLNTATRKSMWKITPAGRLPDFKYLADFWYLSALFATDIIVNPTALLQNGMNPIK
jgi:hypothetical protein